MDADRAELDAMWQAQLTSGAVPAATKFLGFELVGFDSLEGWCEARFTATAQMLNPGGSVQGGFVTAMLDDVMSLAGSICQPVHSWVPTLQMTTSFIRPMKPGLVLARGELVYTSKSVVHTEGVLTDAAGKVLARGAAACVPRAVAAV